MPVQAEESRRTDIIVLGLFAGVLTGLLEALVLAVKTEVFGRPLHMSHHFVWMAPVADVMFFGGPAIVLAALAGLIPAAVRVRAASFVFLTAGFGALLMMYPRWHPLAGVLLGAGAAFQVSGVLARHPVRMMTFARRGLIVGAALVLTLAVGSFGRLWLAEQHALGALPPAKSGAPNVLLVVLDTVRAMNMSLYGYQRPTTPKLQAFAAEGVRFDQAFSTAPWTVPSHASLLTGRYPHELSADWLRPLDDAYPTLAEEFGRHGYDTAAFVANLGYLSWEGFERGFAHYQDYLIRWSDMAGTTSIGAQLNGNLRVRALIGTDQYLARVAAPHISAPLLDWIGRHPDRPFFAFLNYFDAHEPYLPPPPWDRKFAPAGRASDVSPVHRMKILQERPHATPEAVQADVDQYDGALAYLDDQLAQLFSALAQGGILDNTVVIVCADHGEEFGEHGLFDHGNSLYRPSVHVPLIVRYPPRVPGGRVVDAPVTLRDVAATLVDLAGLGSGGPIPGTSLARLWTPGPPATADSPVLSELSRGVRTPPWFPASRGDMRSLVAYDSRYILAGDGSEQLFGLADEWEQNPLAGRDAIVALFRAELRRWPWRH